MKIYLENTYTIRDGNTLKIKNYTIDEKKKTLMKVVNTDRIYMRHIIARILHISQLKKNLLSIGCF